jgi:hypothetical protein
MLSKNTSSSRAIPFAKMVEAVQHDPFIPIAWQKHHSGMQGSEYFTEIDKIQINDEEPYSYIKDWIIHNWLLARDYAINQATILSNLGITKQLCNRLLEPFMWTTMLITGSREGWGNFFNLRCLQYQFHEDEPVFKSKKDYLKYYNDKGDKGFSKDFNDYNYYDWAEINKGQAEIHMMALAECIWDAVSESTPKVLKEGEWHIPFEDKLPTLKVAYTDDGLDYREKCTTEDKIFMSVAMAARTSYTVVGEEKAINYEAMIGLHDRLLAQDPPHSSPLEHCAKAMSEDEYYNFIKGERVDKEGIHYASNFSRLGWCNNLKGFIPYRYMVDNGIEI